MNTVRAISKRQRLGVLKARKITREIQGKSVEKAIDFLTYCEKKAAKMVHKTLLSAVANAENNYGMDIDDLVVVSAFADQGPVMKRTKARAKGRGTRILKPSCHITVHVANPNEEKS